MDIWDILIAGMPRKPTPGCDFWSDGAEILCRTEEQAEAVADLLKRTMPFPPPSAGLYDPEKDEWFGIRYMGWHYVSF